MSRPALSVSSVMQDLVDTQLALLLWKCAEFEKEVRD